VAAGTKVKLPDGRVVAARTLSGPPGAAVPPQQPERRGGGAGDGRAALGQPQHDAALERL